MVNEENGAKTFQDLGQDESETPVTEKFSEGGLNPQSHGGFVHGHESGRIKRHEKEIMPVQQHASNGRGVIGVTSPVLV
jgi:hypothetical protein